MMMNLVRDIRHSARSLWKSKGFSIAVIATMTFCIGANTAVLSALYGFVLKPLPVEDPERFVQLFNVEENRMPGPHSASSWTQYVDLRERTDLFEGCALSRSMTEIIGHGATSRRVIAQKVTAEFFDLTAATPLFGKQDAYPTLFELTKHHL